MMKLHFTGVFAFVLFLGVVILIVLYFFSSQNSEEVCRKVQGFNVQNVNVTQLNDIKNSYDGYGDWVCVNVKNMSYSRAIEVCNHEVGHEIFAEYCEKDENINKCINLTNEY